MGTQLPAKRGGTGPNFRPCPLWPNGQTAGWIKMPLAMETDRGPGDIALEWEPTAPPKKGAQPPPPPIFGPCLLWPNGWKVEGLEKRLGLGLARSRSRLVAKIKHLGLVSWNCRKVLVSVCLGPKTECLGLVS